MKTEMVRALLMLPEVGDAQVSYDGSLLAYMLRKPHWEDGSQLRRLVICKRGGAGSEALPELHSIEGTSPRWSPVQNVMACFASRESGSGEMLLLWEKADSRVLCEVPSGSHALTWSPQGRYLSFLAPAPSPDSDPNRAWTVLDEPAPSIELWIIDTADPAARCITQTGGQVTSHAWHPDEDRLVCCANTSSAARHWDSGSAFVTSVDGSCVRHLPQNGCLNAVWSPLGDRIAIEQLRDPSFLKNPYLRILDASGEQIASFDLGDEFRILHWVPQGLLCLRIKGPSSTLCWVNPETGDFSMYRASLPEGFTLIEGWFGAGCAVTADSRLLSAVCYDKTHPGEAALIRLDEELSVTYVTDARASYRSWDVPAPTCLTWTTSDDTNIEGILIEPNGAMQRKRPLIVILHGGPTAMASQAPLADNDWIWGVVPEVIRRGAMVLLPNYRGSIGYGDSFRAANAGRLGWANLEDVQSGIEHLVKHREVDAGRIAVVGASHGGYLAAFLAATSHRIAAAVVRSGISDWTLNARLNLNPDWERQYFAGTPEERRADYDAASVLPHVTSGTAPTLIIHGDRDRQAPTANAYALHRALSNAQVPCRTILYHEMGHGGASIHQTAHSLEETLQWLERWIHLHPDAECSISAASTAMGEVSTLIP